MSEVNENQTQLNEEVESQPTSEQTEKTSDEKQEVRTFTQDEVNAMMKERIERERKKYEGFDDLKQKASEYEKKLEEQRLAELSEKERAEELAKKAEEQAQQYASQLEELQAQIKRERVTNEFIKLANANNIAYVDDALKLADLSAVEFGEDGAPVGVDEIVKGLVESKPFLLKQSKPKPVGDPSNDKPDTKADKTSEQILKEAEEKARRTGRMEDRIAYSKLKRELGK